MNRRVAVMEQVELCDAEFNAVSAGTSLKGGIAAKLERAIDAAVTDGAMTTKPLPTASIMK